MGTPASAMEGNKGGRIGPRRAHACALELLNNTTRLGDREVMWENLLRQNLCGICNLSTTITMKNTWNRRVTLLRFF